jgi:replicative DNA helicase
VPRNAEQALISSVLRTRDLSAAMDAGVEATWFHAHIDEWEWIEAFHGKYKQVPSTLTFKRQFPKFTVLQVDDTKHYIEEVRQRAMRSRLTSLMKDAVREVGLGDSNKALTMLHSGILSIGQELDTAGTDSDIMIHNDDVMKEVSRRVKRFKKYGMAGYPLGFPTLDKGTGGVQPGQVWVIAGRPGAAKTSTMLRMAAATVQAGHKVQFDALEMTRAEVAIRFYSFLSGDLGKQVFDSLSVTQGRDLSMLAYRKHIKELGNVVGGRFHVADRGRGKLSPMTVIAQIEKNEPDIVFIDYITLMERKADDYTGVAQLMGELKGIAMEYQVPIVVASQLNRGATQVKNVGTENLSQSDAIGQDADAVIAVQKQSGSVRRFQLIKYRHGPDGHTWYTEYNPSKGIFREVDKQRAEDLKDADRAKGLMDDE